MYLSKCTLSHCVAVSGQLLRSLIFGSDSRLLALLIDSFLSWGFFFFFSKASGRGLVSHCVCEKTSESQPALLQEGRNRCGSSRFLHPYLEILLATFFIFANKPELDIVLRHAPVREFFFSHRRLLRRRGLMESCSIVRYSVSFVPASCSPAARNGTLEMAWPQGYDHKR